LLPTALLQGYSAVSCWYSTTDVLCYRLHCYKVAVRPAAGTAQLMCFVTDCIVTVRGKQNCGTILTSVLMSVQIATLTNSNINK